MTHEELCRRAYLWAVKYLKAPVCAQEPTGFHQGMRNWDIAAVAKTAVHAVEVKVSRSDLLKGLSKGQLGLRCASDCPSDYLGITSPGVTYVWLALPDTVQWDDLAASGRLPWYVGILRPGVICDGLYHSKACGGRDGQVHEVCRFRHIPGLHVIRRAQRISTTEDQKAAAAAWERKISKANTLQICQAYMGTASIAEQGDSQNVVSLMR